MKFNMYIYSVPEGEGRMGGGALKGTLKIFTGAMYRLHTLTQREQADILIHRSTLFR